MKTIIFALMALLAFCAQGLAEGSYADPGTKEFFNSLMTPVQGWSCCDQSDCDVVPADFRDGHWIAETRLGQPGETVEVPPEIVLKDKVSPFQIAGIGLAILCEARTGNAEAKPVTGSMGTKFLVYCFVIPPTFG